MWSWYFVQLVRHCTYRNTVYMNFVYFVYKEKHLCMLPFYVTFPENPINVSVLQLSLCASQVTDFRSVQFLIDWKTLLQVWAWTCFLVRGKQCLIILCLSSHKPLCCITTILLKTTLQRRMLNLIRYLIKDLKLFEHVVIMAK